jgi:hypothetical protein
MRPRPLPGLYLIWSYVIPIGSKVLCVEQDLRYDGFESLRMFNARFNNFLVMTCGSASPFNDDLSSEMFFTQFSRAEVRSASCPLSITFEHGIPARCLEGLAFLLNLSRTSFPLFSTYPVMRALFLFNRMSQWRTQLAILHLIRDFLPSILISNANRPYFILHWLSSYSKFCDGKLKEATTISFHSLSI